jgi:hypothetical protein
MRASGTNRDCWPTRQQALLLRAALLQGRPALDAWQGWKSQADIDHLDPGSFRVLPQLYQNLTSLQVQDPLMRKLKGIYRRSWYTNQLALRDLAGLLQGFAAAGIDSLLLKNVALVLCYYRDIGLRPVDDLEVLVRIEHALAAMAVMTGLGWEPLAGVPSSELVKTGAPCSAWKAPRGQSFTLYWRVAWEGCEPGAEAEWWEGATSVVYADVQAHVLNPADQLLHVCMAWAEWHTVPAFRWAADAMTILHRAGSDLDWDRLMSRARNWGMTLPVRDTLHCLRRLLDAPFPSELLRGLRRVRVSPLERIEYRRRTRAPGPTSVLERIVSRYLRVRERRRRVGPLDELWGFTRFLQEYWGLAYGWQVPLWAGLKALRGIPRMVLGLRARAKGSSWRVR